ncbi:MAG: N-acetylmuramic acid 6-phosphate etherase [Flavobacteriaceae bacterium]
MINTTELDSLHDNLESRSTLDIVERINREDQKVALEIQKNLKSIESLIDAIVPKMQKGGRLFYIGAGTSGRLGVLDASECPPTFGVDPGKVIGLIAGGDHALRHAVENAEDDLEQAWIDLEKYEIGEQDSLIGIAASGRTPYVIGGLNQANNHGLLTGCVVCSSNSKIAELAQYPVEIIVGPEFITGSTRMKSGSAQKMVLNMITTSIMIKLGHVKGNKMIDMKLSNDKLIDRGTRMVAEALGIEKNEALKLLTKHGSVRAAINIGKA